MRLCGGRCRLHRILTNPIYADSIGRMGKFCDGQHPAIIDLQVWDQVQVKLAEASAKPGGTKVRTAKSPLSVVLFDGTPRR